MLKMKTNPLSQLLSILLMMLITLLLASLEINAATGSNILGGNEVNGDLIEVTISDAGGVILRRWDLDYNSTTTYDWQRTYYDTDQGNGLSLWNDSTCIIQGGYFSTIGNSNISLSHKLINPDGSETITRTWTGIDGDSTGIVLVETFNLSKGAYFYTRTIEIKNNSGSDLDNIRLYLGGDVYLRGSDSSYSDIDFTTGSVYTYQNSMTNFLTLRGINSTPPTYYHASHYLIDGYSRIELGNNLLNLTHPYAPDINSIDSGYYLQWGDKDGGPNAIHIPNGSSYTIETLESFGELIPNIPIITGPTNMSLNLGYEPTSTDTYSITSIEPFTVTTDNNYNNKITWNTNTNKLDIASGLATGEYTVKLTAINDISSSSALTFMLTVKDIPQTGDYNNTLSQIGLENTITAIQLSAQNLSDINPDYIGWIRIKDTTVDYPIVQGWDNEQYLKTNFIGEKNPSGSIFMDWKCDESFDAPLTILYGHNMNNGNMFASLHNYQDNNFLLEHPDITIITPKNEILIYRIFTAKTTDVNDAIFDLVKKDQKLGDTDTPKVLVLSTCTNGENYDERLLVFAVKIDENDI